MAYLMMISAMEKKSIAGKALERNACYVTQGDQESLLMRKVTIENI